MRVTFRAILSVAVAIPVLALAGCDETIDATKAPATSDAGSDATTASDAATDAPVSLFTRLGGEPGLVKLIDALVAAEVADPEIASYFVFNGAPAAGHPSVTQIKECFVKQVGTALGGPGFTYPTAVSGGFQCRDMGTAHKDLHIGGLTFDKFATIAAATATAAGVPADGLAALSGFLTANRPLIVDPAREDAGGPFDSGIKVDSGSDTGSDAAAPSDAATDGG